MTSAENMAYISHVIGRDFGAETDWQVNHDLQFEEKKRDLRVVGA